MRLTTSNAREVTMIRALLHGDSGIGKTTSLATLPEDKTLIAVRERGLLPLRKRNYPVVVLDEWADVRRLIDALYAAEQAQDGSLSVVLGDEVLSGIKVLALDSLTEVNELCKRDIVDNARPAIVRERSGGKRARVEGIYDEQLTMEDWGVLATRMADVISAINHLPLHTVVTALSEWKEDKRTGSNRFVPALNGKLATSCPAYFELVMHMESAKDGDGNDVRVWRTFNDGVHLCKDSTGILDPFVVPDWSEIFRAILNGTNGKEQKHADAQ